MYKSFAVTTNTFTFYFIFRKKLMKSVDDVKKHFPLWRFKLLQTFWELLALLLAVLYIIHFLGSFLGKYYTFWIVIN